MRKRESGRTRTLVALIVVAAIAAVGLGLFAWRSSAARAERQSRRDRVDACVAMTLGEYGDALVRAERILAGRPGSRVARMIRARSLVGLERGGEAGAEAEAILEKNPDDWIAHLTIVMATTQAGGYFGGSLDPHIVAVERLAPYTAEALALRSIAADSSSSAQALLRLALRLDPESAEALVVRIGRHLEAGDLDEALEDAERLIEAHPGEPFAQRMRAEVLSRRARDGAGRASGMLGDP